MSTDKNSATEMLTHRLASRSRLPIRVFALVALAALAMWLALVLARSMPQRTVAMAVYPEGTLNAELVKRYKAVLARSGIDLKLVPSSGAVETVARLRDPKSPISVAIIPGGITTAQDSPELVSLGTLFYQPVWVFSRGHPLQRREPLRSLRVGIGVQGSSSRALTLKLLGRIGVVVDENSVTLLLAAPSDRALRLINGETDVAVFVDAWEGAAVQQLLNTKNVNLESIARADAFVAIYPYLDKLVLPAGVLDMVEPRPPTDVVLIATKASLVVRNDLHPAIQYRLLEAAAEIHSTHGIFHAASQFPAAESVDLPLSPYARDFYKTGPPFLLRHLPFWLAVLLAQPVVWLIPVLIILFPVFRVAPAIYDWLEKRRVYRLYSELKRLEDEMGFAALNGSRKDFIERLDRLEDRASRLSVPTSFKPLVYSLRLHIDMVRQEAAYKVPVKD